MFDCSSEELTCPKEAADTDAREPAASILPVNEVLKLPFKLADSDWKELAELSALDESVDDKFDTES